MIKQIAIYHFGVNLSFHLRSLGATDASAVTFSPSLRVSWLERSSSCESHCENRAQAFAQCAWEKASVQRCKYLHILIYVSCSSKLVHTYIFPL